ncbi:MAG: hypothetical protein RL385_5169, partial [Pseudomonadota bacterium]
LLISKIIHYYHFLMLLIIYQLNHLINI